MEDIKKINKEINKLTKKGDVQQAIEYCQKLLQISPSDTNLHVRLGDLYLDRHLDIYQAKQYIDEAITEYQKAAEVLIDNGDIYYKIGVALYYKGELDKAINYFNIALDKKIKNVSDCHFMISNCLKKKDRFHDALTHIEIALKGRFFNSSRMHYSKSKLLKMLFFTNKKLVRQSRYELFLAIITLPFDSEAIKKLDRLYYIKTVFFAEMNAARGDYEKAFQIYNDAIDRMQGYADLYAALGNLYAKTGRLDEAITEFKMALWLDPLSYRAHSGLVAAYEELGDYDNAIAYSEKYIRIHPNCAPMHSNLGNLYFVKGEVEKAIPHYQAAIIINPESQWTASVAHALGHVQQAFLKNTDSAIANYCAANALNPKEIEIYISLGSAFYDNEDYKNALIAYRKALEIDPDNSKIHCNLGYLYWGMGDIDEAIKEYKLSIKFDSNYDIAYNNLGVIYLDDLVQIQNAMDCFNKAIECNPNYALAYYNLGRCYALKNDNIEAAKYFQTSMDVNNITNEIDPQDIQERLNNLFN